MNKQRKSPPGSHHQPKHPSPPLSTFTTNSSQHHSRSQSLQTQSDQLKRLTTPAVLTAPNMVTTTTTPASSTSSLHILSKIFSQLATKHRFEQNIEQLNDSFVHMEHRYPGSSESFIKHILDMMKIKSPAATATTTTNSSASNH